ncbi:metal ABC transporter permease [bacterium]|nr:metal ABC transporter permease [bacterium]
MAELIDIFEIEFMQHALYTGLLVGIMCSFLGVYIVLRRIVFVGASLAQISSTGFAIGIIFEMNPVVSAMALTMIGVVWFAFNLNSKKIPQDSTLALGYIIASASAILILSKHPKGDADLLGLLFGNILTITSDQIYILLAALIILGSIHLIFYKEFLFVSFDPEMSETLGFRPQIWNVLFYVTVGMLISLAIKSAGILLVFGLLVIPPIAAILITEKISRVFAWSVLIAVISIPSGLYLSFTQDIPSAPTIIALMTLWLGISFTFNKLRHAVA